MTIWNAGESGPPNLTSLLKKRGGVFYGQTDSLHHADGAGDALACDIEGGAVAYGCAQNGHTCRNRTQKRNACNIFRLTENTD